MDATTVLILIETLLIILAVAVYKANGFISPSPHAFNPVPFLSSNNDDIPKSTVVPSSSSEITVVHPQVKYEVFLSFRGEDTRDTFTSHLYDALCRAKIHTFIDNRLGKGEQISPVLLRTIEESQISVVIFSENYASSTWCLDELKTIVECKERYARTLIPVFYNIDPSIVKKQSGSYGEALVKLKQRFENNMSKIEEWKFALTQAANVSGWDSSITKPESKLVKEIVKDICTKLNRNSSYDFPAELVGIEHHVMNVEKLLSLESPEVHTVGICGMGGIGKTTIAQALFHKLKPQFDSHSFVANIRENLTRYGVDHLLNKCLSELLDDKDIGTNSDNRSSSISRLGRLRILLVLDDVDNSIHVEDIIKVHDWCGKGSRIIVTSRDMHVLKNSGAYIPYNVPQMEFHDALHLFCLNAFKQNNPIEDYWMLVERAVDYCEGIPLALKVLGSSLYGRRKEEWESVMQKLEQTPDTQVINVLKLSFDGLDEDQKNKFLDMACFSRVTMNEIYRFYDFTAKSDMTVLRERCLISYDTFFFDKIIMHNLVKAMGQQICRLQFINEPRKPIRLWNQKEIYHVLKNNKGIERIECISLDTRRTKRIVLKADVFGRMCNLRFLEFYSPDIFDRFLLEESKVIVEGINILPEELIILHWEEYPLPFVPLNFCAENLVTLQMPDSSLVQLWEGDLQFPNLKKIDISGSQQLSTLPDLCQTPNIEEIDVSFCTSLLQIYSSTPLHKLSKLWLDDCWRLKSVGVSTSSNQLLLFWKSYHLQYLPLSFYSINLVFLSLTYSNLKQLWDGDQHFPNLKQIDLGESRDLIKLPDLCQTPNIVEMRLYNCASLLQIYSSSPLGKLVSLDLDGCSNIHSVEIPARCNQLRFLYWSKCPLRSLPLTLCSENLVYLRVECGKLEQLWDGSLSFPLLLQMDLHSCKDLVSLPDLSQTPNIEEIDLTSCVNLAQVHSSSILANLESLKLEDCKKLRVVNVSGNVIHQGTSSSVLVVVYNYFDLQTLSFIKVTVKVFMCDDGVDTHFSGFRLKVESAPLTDVSEYSESAEIKSLVKSFSSLLPFVSKLRWLDVTSYVDDESHFQTRLSHFDYDDDGVLVTKFTKLKLEKAELGVMKLQEKSKILRHSCIMEVSMIMSLEDLREEEEKEDCLNEKFMITRVPISITRWSLLTELSLQKSEIESIQSLSGLKLFGECDGTWLQPIRNVWFSVNSERDAWDNFDICHSQELYHCDSTITTCLIAFQADKLSFQFRDQPYFEEE